MFMINFSLFRAFFFSKIFYYFVCDLAAETLCVNNNKDENNSPKNHSQNIKPHLKNSDG